VAVALAGHVHVCTSLQTDNHASTSPLSFFTGRMPFLPPNQQRQSTEGINSYTMHAVKITPNLLFEYRCTVQAANLSDCRIESNRNFFFA